MSVYDRAVSSRRPRVALLVAAGVAAGCASHPHQMSARDYARTACSEWHTFSVTSKTAHVNTDQLPLAAVDAERAARAAAYRALGIAMHEAIADAFPHGTTAAPHVERLTQDKIHAVDAACAEVHS